MTNKMNPLKKATSTIVSEMFAGKQAGLSNFISRTFTNGFYKSSPTVNYTRNDYPLFRSIYMASLLTSSAKDYLLAAPLAKPIINATAAFTLGTGVTMGLTATSVSEVQARAAEDAVNRWLKDNQATIFNWFTHGTRDGDSYVYIDELGNVAEEDADTVEVRLDPMSGDVIGFDITVKTRVETRVGVFEDRTIVKSYRQNSIVYTQYKNNNLTKGEVIYQMAFTEDGLIVPNDTEMKQLSDEDFIKRPLPVVHFANEKEPAAIYGNSDLQNLLLSFKQYAKVLDNATAGVVYNSNPLPWITGKTNILQNANQTVDWSPDKILYGDADSKFGFLHVTGIMDDAEKLLNYYFYLIVEGSETPEFVFGAAIQGSKASTETQLPVMIQKAERKRAQFSSALQQLIESYIDRQIYMSNPVFLPFKGREVVITPQYPDLVEGDKKLNKDLVQFLHESGLIKDETVLKVLANDIIDDPAAEVDAARKEVAARNAANNIMPEETDRFDSEGNPIDENGNRIVVDDEE